MMNLLALSLVVTSLAAAGVWSPSPEKQKHGVDVIVKEVHRTIVVEYDEDGQPITKVSISPEEQQHANNMAKEKKIEEASSVNGGRESHVFPKELICDAFGKCKHRVASAMGKAKERVSEAAHEAIEKKEEMAHEVGEAASHALGKAKETVSQKAHEAIGETKERTHEVGEAAGHALGKAKETVSQKAHEVEERAKESVEAAMGKVKEEKDIIAMNVSDKAEKAKEEAVKKAKEASDKVKRGILGRGRQVGHDAVKYVTSAEAMGVVNLLGFATAYGMCMWVTFISSYVLAAVMPRQQFGIVQSKIYPVYFRAMACSIAMALLGLVLGNGRRMFSSTVAMLQGCNLLASLLMVFLNALYLEPRATKVMFERMKMEKEEGGGREELTADEPSRVSDQAQPPVADATASTTTSTAPAARAEQEVVRSRMGRLSDRLKKLNSYSSFLNILTLMALNWHLVYLAHLLHLITC